MNEEKFKKGEIVLKEGEKGDKFFFIEKGEAKAYKNVGKFQVKSQKAKKKRS